MTLAVNCNNKHSLESLIKLLIRDEDCELYVECDKREGLEALAKQLFSVLEDGTLALNVCECDAPEPPALLTFKMVFDDIANADTMIGGDSSDVADWNTFFDLPTNGTPFTSVTVTLNTVELLGVADIKLRDYVFGDNDPNGTSLLEVDDEGCVIECGNGVFSDYNTGDGCYAVTKIHLPACSTLGNEVFADCAVLSDLVLPFDSYTTLGDDVFNWVPLLPQIDFINLTSINSGSINSQSPFWIDPDFTSLITDNGNSGTGVSYCSGMTHARFSSMVSCGQSFFLNCTSLVNIDLSSMTDLGGTIGDDSVFNGITGNTITITIPHALETDGDIVWLVANNTVTIIYSD